MKPINTDVARWGQGYFAVNEHGHLETHPDLLTYR